MLDLKLGALEKGPQVLCARGRVPLRGQIHLPGDKSISHRALMLSSLAAGESRITGLLEGEDVLATAAAMRALGVEIERDAEGNWHVHGVGLGGLSGPEDILDMGNSGTGARLLLGILAGHPLCATLTGDASLRARPMGRVLDPLRRMGAGFSARAGDQLPLTVTGASTAVPIEYELPVPSAQVKSAVLFAGLNAPGQTTVVEPVPTRDHTERMFSHFGATLNSEILEQGGRRITVTGQPELIAQEIIIPADPSSAAFPLVAGLIVPGSEITLKAVGLNPLRTGLFESLREMGADIAFENEHEAAGEPVADIQVRASALQGIEVPAARAPSMIDEYPILAVAAACATGRSVMRGLAELRVKESDRLTGIAEGLSACGVTTQILGDDLIVEGLGGPPPGGGFIQTRLDHRIAMAFLVLGLASITGVTIDDARPIETSFPGFAALIRGLGGTLESREAP